MIKIKKNLSIIIMAVFVLSFAYMLVSAVAVNAQIDPNEVFWGNLETNIQESLGLGNAKDPRLIAASIINVILGFLGLIAVVIILLGGFKWMTAGGNEDKIGEAKGLLVAGLIGLIVIVASWGISKFVLNLVFNAVQG